MSTMSTTPIADQVTAELAALKDAGFTDNQAKTIIVARTMESANLSKQITAPESRKLIALIDAYEAKWVPAPNDPPQWYSPDAHLMTPRSREALDASCGPLTEVFA